MTNCIYNKVHKNDTYAVEHVENYICSIYVQIVYWERPITGTNEEEVVERLFSLTSLFHIQFALYSSIARVKLSMRNCRYLVAIVAVCSWIGVVSMPVPLWSLSSVKYMLAHTDQSTRPLTDQSHSAMFDKSAYLQQVEESRVRGHVINRAINTIVYDPIPLEDGDYSENFLSQVSIYRTYRQLCMISSQYESSE